MKEKSIEMENFKEHCDENFSSLMRFFFKISSHEIFRRRIESHRREAWIKALLDRLYLERWLS